MYAKLLCLGLSGSCPNICSDDVHYVHVGDAVEASVHDFLLANFGFLEAVPLHLTHDLHVFYGHAILRDATIHTTGHLVRYVLNGDPWQFHSLVAMTEYIGMLCIALLCSVWSSIKIVKCVRCLLCLEILKSRGYLSYNVQYNIPHALDRPCSR